MEKYIRTLEEAIMRYNGEYILSKIKEKKDEFLNIKTEQKEATYMFIDIKGFTQYAEKLLSNYFLVIYDWKHWIKI